MCGSSVKVGPAKGDFVTPSHTELQKCTLRISFGDFLINKDATISETTTPDVPDLFATRVADDPPGAHHHGIDALESNI